MIARGEAHVVRLATAYAVLDLSPVIQLPHLLAALAIWDFSEASAGTSSERNWATPTPTRCSVHFGRARMGSPPISFAITSRGTGNRSELTAPSQRSATRASWSSGTEATGGRPAKRYRVKPAAAKAAGEGYLARARSVSGRAVSAVSVERADPNTNQGETLPPEECAVSPSGQRATGLSAQLPRTYSAPPSLDSEVEEGDTALSALTAQSPHMGVVAEEPLQRDPGSSPPPPASDSSGVEVPGAASPLPAPGPGERP